MLGSDWGFLLLDKPEGLTSHTAARRAARALGFKKTGHAGTLDPMATGLMLVGLGRATRLLEYLVGCDKTYLATIRLGIETDTLDREGIALRERDCDAFSIGEIESALAAFVGEFTQTPPLHSAIKVGGQPLYKLARKGVEATAPERVVRVYSISLLEYVHPEVVIEVACGSGTYIRSLARDIGNRLGVPASLWALRRTATGPFRVEDASKLDELSPEAIRNPSEMIYSLPNITLERDGLNALVHGKSVETAQLPEFSGEVAVFDGEGGLSAMCEKNGEILKPRKVFLDQPQVVVV